MAVYEKWQSERYSIGCKVWEARCPNCHYLVESTEHISSNYRFCPYCGFDMKFDTERIALNKQYRECLTELKEAKRLVTQLKAKLCDSSEYCAYCDELDMSERDYFTCKRKKKKIPAVCHWQTLTPAHFDDIPWTKNKAVKEDKED